MIIFTDRCLAQIAEGIAAFEPERGGALLKLPNSNIVCEFVPDPGARVSSASYTPSAELTPRIREAEHDQALHFAGIIHSHPGALMVPSSQDHRAFALSLALNPRLGAFIAPIVTLPVPFDPLEPHQIQLRPRGILSLHVCYRGPRPKSDSAAEPAFADLAENEGPAAYGNRGELRNQGRFLRNLLADPRRDDPRNDEILLFQPAASVLTLDADIAFICDLIRDRAGIAHSGTDISYVTVNGTAFISTALHFSELEIVLMLAAGYPFTPPVVLYTPMIDPVPQNTAEVEFSWPIAGQDERLARLTAAILALHSDTLAHYAPVLRKPLLPSLFHRS